MRVVDVNEFYSPTGGGVRTYIDHKMTIMAELGHEMIVIAPAKANSVEERPGGGKIYWVKAPRLILDPNYGIFVRGGAIHSEEEYLISDSLVERAGLAAVTMLRLAERGLGDV